MKRSNIIPVAAILAIWAGAVPCVIAQEGEVVTTVTAATGTITHLNYGNDGEVAGFLIGTNILLTLPANVCGGLTTLGVVGNSITYSGKAHTTASGFETVLVTSLTNDTTKATYTPAASRPTVYGPVSGTVKQPNYAEGGLIDGFVFTPVGSASPIFVSTGSRASSALASLLTVGATVSVTGTTSASMSACASTAALEAVDTSSLTIGTKTVVISGGGHGH